jgi:hypothetical protein
MERMREKWTDERLDDMNERMRDGFARVDHDLRDLRLDMNRRFDASQQLILRVGAGMFGTMVIGFIGLLVSQH